jgi:hypothetical protein
MPEQDRLPPLRDVIAAHDLAAKKSAAGDAQAAVIRLNNEAAAGGVKASVDAFGGGDKYAQYLLTTHFAPAIKDIWSNTDGFFATLFKSLASPVSPPGPTTAPAPHP